MQNNPQTLSLKAVKNRLLSLLMMVAIIICTVSCEKDELQLIDGIIPGGTQPVADNGNHLTCTRMIETGEGEVLFSLTLSSSKSTADAIIYCSADSIDFSRSVFLTAGVNINEKPLDEGPSELGVKAVLPAVDVKEQGVITYYFRIEREGRQPRVVYFGFELLECGRYYIEDSNDPRLEQDFCYYIKADEDGNPCFINIKFN